MPSDALTVQLSARLDRQRFVQRIERLLSYAQDGPAAVFAHSPAGDLPPPASVRAVFGRVAFTDGTVCDVSAACGTFRLTSAADGPQCSLVFVGFELSDAVQAQLHEAVLQARPPLPQPMQHKSRQGLEPTEREAIRSATLSAPLPEGVVFDGQSFVSFSGAVSKVRQACNRHVRLCPCAHLLCSSIHTCCSLKRRTWTRSTRPLMPSTAHCAMFNRRHSSSCKATPPQHSLGGHANWNSAHLMSLCCSQRYKAQHGLPQRQ